MSYIELNKQNTYIIGFILLFLFGFLSYDTFVDYQSGSSLLHILFEFFLLASLFIMILITAELIYKKYKKTKVEMTNLEQDFESLKKKMASFKSDVHDYLEINFKNWDLTKSEKDIALLLFKGCTPKEISATRQTNYQTVRSQISRIYKKANVNNHNQFMSILLEDIL